MKLHNKLHFPALAAIGLSLAISAYSGTVRAQALGAGEDDKGMTGAQCQPSNGAQWDQFLVYPRGIKNNSASGKYISCTIDTDSEASTWDTTYPGSGTGTGYAYLRLVFDYSTGGGTTTCTAYLTEDGGTVHTHSNSVAGPLTAVRKFMTIGPMYAGSAETAPVAFNCLMPAGVVLTNINLSEIQDTDDQYLYTP